MPKIRAIPLPTTALGMPTVIITTYSNGMTPPGTPAAPIAISIATTIRVRWALTSSGIPQTWATN